MASATALGARIRAAFEQARRSGLVSSQRDFERKAGLGVGYSSRLFSDNPRLQRGQRIDPDMLQRIAETLGVTVDDLTAGTPTSDSRLVSAERRPPVSKHSAKERARAWAILMDHDPEAIREIDRVRMADGRALTEQEWVEKYVQAQIERQSAKPYKRDRTGETTDPQSEERVAAIGRKR